MLALISHRNYSFATRNAGLGGQLDDYIRDWRTALQLEILGGTPVPTPLDYIQHLHVAIDLTWWGLSNTCDSCDCLCDST